MKAMLACGNRLDFSEKVVSFFMTVFTIAGLTLKEAARRRTLAGAFLLGLPPLGLSLILIIIRARMQQRWSAEEFAYRYPFAESAMFSLSLSAIKLLGALFAALLAGGAISGEIERGLLAPILAKPVQRWQILLGKWIGIQTILAGSVLLWTFLVWGSFTAQTHRNLTPMLHAGIYLTLFPVLLGTLTLSLSTFAQRLFGTSLALTLAALSWADGILNTLGATFDVDALHPIASVLGLLTPQGYVGWMVDRALGDLIIEPPGRSRFGVSPQFLNEWGAKHLHFARLDAAYIAAYLLIVFVLGAAALQRRDI